MSSYYDDASLMLLAGGGAQKDGKVYSIKPVPVYGSEKITNGDFATDSDWTKGSGWTISGGSLNGSSATATSFQQNTGIVAGKTYKATYTISNYSSGSIRIELGSANVSVGITRSANGTYTEDIEALGDETIYFDGISAFTGSIDNVSVKEVLVSDGDFTFSRGSNLAATRVGPGPDYFIEKGRENLLLQSNNFNSSPWIKSSTSLTSGQSGYDGSSDAWLLSKSSANGSVRQNITTSGVKTFSIYAKANTNDWIRLRFDNSSGDQNLWVNLSNGSIGTNSGIATYVTDIGGGWYRVAFQSPSTDLLNFRIYPAEENSTTGTSGSVYIQDSQLEQGLVATDYIPTTTTTGTAGILEDTPRFNYSFGASCPSLLLEPSRTNLFLFSEPFQNESNSGGITYESFDWSLGFSNCVRYGDNSQVRFRYGATTSASTEYTLSAFIIMDDLSEPAIGGQVSSNDFSVVIGGDVFNSPSPSINMGNNIWRISVTGTTSASPNATNNGIIKYTSQSSKGFRVVGYQLEAGAYATSYIPTYGTSVTRAADVCGGAGDANTFNSTEGVLYAEIASLVGDEAIGQMSVSNGSDNENVKILWLNANKIRLEAKTVSGTNFVKDINVERNGDFYKLAIQYKSNDYKVYVNGISQAVSQVASTPNGLNKLNFNRGDGNSVFYGNVKQVLTFNTALSDLDLAILTGATTYNTFAEMAVALNYTVYE